MSKIKPLLFGTIAGAAVMFVALQFHVVHSDEGFYLVPRAHQPPIGAAWADVRGWTPTDYAENPELVAALHKNGSMDIIGDSIRERVTEQIDGVLAPLDVEVDGKIGPTEKAPTTIDSFLNGLGATESDTPRPVDPLPPVAEQDDDSRYARSERFDTESKSSPVTQSRTIAGLIDDEDDDRSYSFDAVTNALKPERRLDSGNDSIDMPSTSYKYGSTQGSNSSEYGSGRSSSYGFRTSDPGAQDRSDDASETADKPSTSSGYGTTRGSESSGYSSGRSSSYGSGASGLGTESRLNEGNDSIDMPSTSYKYGSTRGSDSNGYGSERSSSYGSGTSGLATEDRLDDESGSIDRPAASYGYGSTRGSGSSGYSSNRSSFHGSSTSGLTTEDRLDDESSSIDRPAASYGYGSTRGSGSSGYSSNRSSFHEPGSSRYGTKNRPDSGGETINKSTASYGDEPARKSVSGYADKATEQVTNRFRRSLDTSSGDLTDRAGRLANDLLNADSESDEFDVGRILGTGDGTNSKTSRSAPGSADADNRSVTGLFRGFLGGDRSSTLESHSDRPGDDAGDFQVVDDEDVDDSAADLDKLIELDPF